jgi:hypothetical protein
VLDGIRPQRAAGRPRVRRRPWQRLRPATED